ncbi:hypothetical protein ZIOFF_016808 [Zingiber officinale]|uniref:Proteasome subunit beta n=1 Tax=Zingiber officinale TaxID=94328 RepID=A0A8J5I315_ZINOF|nr:hypothetical protein ZIOFF_016808 [Zingiber officinale]
MECVFGLVGDGFALVAADSSAVNSILVHKSNEDKIMILDSHKLLGASGEAGDRVQFTEYIQKNVHLYEFRNGIPLSTAAAANFTRGELAQALRKDMDNHLERSELKSLDLTPISVGIITSKFVVTTILAPSVGTAQPKGCIGNGRDSSIAGYDKDIGPSLYYIDYIATLHKVDKGAFGYGSFFSLSMMDRHYHSGMSLKEAVDLVDKCIVEIRTRLVVSPPNFVIKIVDKDGAKEYAWRETIKDAEEPTA